MLTREETIEKMCAIVGLVYKSLGDFSKPSDGFCPQCTRLPTYQNDGHIVEWVERVVVEELKRITKDD